MRFEPHTCPSCGGIATGTSETIPGVALLDFDADGNAEYAGETKMCWDGQQTEIDADGNAELWCGEGHCWPARMDEEE